MEFTLLPKSPRTTILLVVVLVGAVLFVVTSGGTSRRRRGNGPVAVATQAAQALADLAVPGPDASAPAHAAVAAGPDTTFGESPFLGAEPELFAGDAPVGDGAGESEPTGEGGLASPPAPPPPHRLLGTIVDTDTRLALIDNRYYSVGQSVGAWQLTLVERGVARLERHGQSITLKVGS